MLFRSFSLLLEEGAPITVGYLAAGNVRVVVTRSRPEGAALVQAITIHNLPLGRSVDEALRVLDALQHFEKHGEVCPADWKPGQAALDPVQCSARSQIPAAGRHTTVGEARASAGQSSLTPSQRSSVSQGPTAESWS